MNEIVAEFEACTARAQSPNWAPASRDDVRGAIIALSEKGERFSLTSIREYLGRPFCYEEAAPIARHVLGLQRDPEAFDGASLPIPPVGQAVISFYGMLDR